MTAEGSHPKNVHGERQTLLDLEAQQASKVGRLASAMPPCTLKLRRVMAGQGRILGDPGNRRPSGPEMLHKLAPALPAWSSESARSTPAWPTTSRW